MYESNQVGYATQPVDAPMPELKSVEKRLSSANSEYTSLLYEVEERLHNIMSQRQPKAEQKVSEKIMPQDYVSSMHEQLGFYEDHNRRLHAVLEHIKRIIG